MNGPVWIMPTQGEPWTLMGKLEEVQWQAKVQLMVDVGQSRRAKSNQEILQGIQENAKESKLNKRAPAKYAEYVNNAMEGTPNETIRISSDGLVELFQANPQMEEDFREFIPDLDNKLAEAQLESGDIEVPTGDYAAYISNKEGAESLTEHVRLKEDDMTMAEAKVFDSKQQERLIEDYKQYEEEIANLQEGQDAGKAIFEDVNTMLTRAERTPQEARVAATLHQNFFTTMAERINQNLAPEDRVDAWQLYSGQKLSVVKRHEQQAAVTEKEFNQKTLAPMLESHFREQDPDSTIRQFKTPVQLADGSRISGFNGEGSGTLVGYDSSGEQFTLSTSNLDPTNIVLGGRANRTATTLKNALDQRQQGVGKPLDQIFLPEETIQLDDGSTATIQRTAEQAMQEIDDRNEALNQLQECING